MKNGGPGGWLDVATLARRWLGGWGRRGSTSARRPADLDLPVLALVEHFGVKMLRNITGLASNVNLLCEMV